VHLTEKQLQQYMEIYQKVFGREISREKALAEGTKLVSLVQLITANSNTNHKKQITN
jgi:hypothetical protein